VTFSVEAIDRTYLNVEVPLSERELVLPLRRGERFAVSGLSVR
jgi:hypothetical protein